MREADKRRLEKEAQKGAVAWPRSRTDLWLCWIGPSACGQVSWIPFPSLIPALTSFPLPFCERSNSPGLGLQEGIILHLCWFSCGRGKSQCWTTRSDPAWGWSWVQTPTPAWFPQPWQWMAFLAPSETEQRGKFFIAHLKNWRQFIVLYTFLISKTKKKPPTSPERLIWNTGRGSKFCNCPRVCGEL